MAENRDPIRDVAEAVLGGLRQIEDCSYAIMPKNIAHSVAGVKKTLLGALTNALRWELDWIDDRVIRRLDDPVAPGEALAILRGSLAPDGAVLKRAAASGPLPSTANCWPRPASGCRGWSPRRRPSVWSKPRWAERAPYRTRNSAS